MAEGKPYRYGLIAAGMCVLLVGLFVMTQERPHIYATLCSLGIIMVTLGTAWSLCQCYPKVVLISQSLEERGAKDSMDAAAGDKNISVTLAGFHDKKVSPALSVPLVLQLHSSHSCPILHLA
ncbi:barttin [Salmo salar]|uniref:Barttin n=1 Tax=Salmo salar TaxID=8030 RepID=A0A1S3PAY2_SALSA|nr:barttin [Salmo salar]|eukprot:XP_014024721.1 PREDICTED: barttin [Salmo salar]